MILQNQIVETNHRFSILITVQTMTSILNFSNRTDKKDTKIVNNNLIQIQTKHDPGIQSRFDNMKHNSTKRVERIRSRNIDSIPTTVPETENETDNVYDNITIVTPTIPIEPVSINEESKQQEQDQTKQVDVSYSEQDSQTNNDSKEEDSIDCSAALVLYIQILRNMNIIPRKRIVLESFDLVSLIANIINDDIENIEIELEETGCVIGKTREVDSIRIIDRTNKLSKDLKTYYPKIWNYIRNELRIELKRILVS